MSNSKSSNPTSQPLQGDAASEHLIASRPSLVKTAVPRGAASVRVEPLTTSSSVSAGSEALPAKASKSTSASVKTARKARALEAAWDGEDVVSSQEASTSEPETSSARSLETGAEPELLGDAPKSDSWVLAQSEVTGLTANTGMAGAESTAASAASSSAAAGAGAVGTSGVAVGAAAGVGAVGAVGVVGAAVGLVAVKGSAKDAAASQSAAASKDETPPVIQSMEAHSNGGAAGAGTIELIYDSELDGSALPDVGAFYIETGGMANAVLSVALKAGSSNILVITLTLGFGPGAVSITYTDPSSSNDARAIQDLAGNDADGFMSGIIADGYIRGAQIYIDTNGNGEADPTEKLTGVVTDSNGNFFLPSKAPVGTIIAVGGINIDTGLPNVIPMKAPAGSTTINPLTTLVQAAMDQAVKSGVTLKAADAAAQVASSLGLSLPPGVSLTNYDPLSAPSNDGVALAAQKAAAQVATIVSLAASAGTGATTAILGNLVKEVSTGTLNLADAGTITSVLSATKISTDTLTQVLDANAAIASAVSTKSISATQSKFMDTVAPDAPVKLVINELVNAPSPMVRVNLNTTSTDGKAVIENDQLVVSVDGVEVGTVTITKADLTAGYKNVTIPATLSEAAHTVGVRAVDIAGNTSSLTQVSFKVDVTAPLAPWVNAVTGDDVISTSDAGKTLSGITDEDAQQVTLVLGTQVRQVSVATDGSWTYALTAADVDALAAMGANAQLRAFAIDRAGNKGSDTYHAVQIDLTANSSATSAVDTTPPPAPMIRSVATDNVINAAETTTQLSGLAEPGATLDIGLGGLTRSVTVDSKGRWTYTLTSADLDAMGQGPETLAVKAIDGAGNASPITTQTISIDTVAPTGLGIQAVAGDNLVNAAELSSLVFSGTSEAGSTVLLTVAGSTRTLTANANGQWTYTPTAADIKAMGQGAETLRVSASDAAGNTTSAVSQDITIQTAAPQLTPFILSASSDSGVLDDRITSQRAPTVNVTAQSGSALSVSLNGGAYTPVGTGTGTSQSIELSGLSAAGVYNIKLRATDAVGNETVRTGSLTVDNQAPGLLQNEVLFTDASGAALKSSLAAGDVFWVTLKFNDRMLVTGTPSLGLMAGATPIEATYLRGSLGNSLVFKATVGSGGIASQDLQISPAGFNRIRSAVTDVAGNALPEWIETKVGEVSLTGVQVSGAASPSAGVPAGYLHAGDVVTASVNFSGVVAVTGQPQLMLDIGGQLVKATYAGGSGTASLRFNYTVLANQSDLDGIGLQANALVLTPGSAIKDANGYSATLTHASVASATAYRVDALPPGVKISSDLNALKAGQTANLTFTLSEASSDFTLDDVTVTGGVLSNFSGSGSLYTATLTPTANSSSLSRVTVVANRFHDGADNANLGQPGGLELPVDTVLPSVQVTVLKTGTLSANLVFNLSEPSPNFSLNSLQVTGGTVSNLSGSGTVYTAIFTATSAEASSHASIDVAAGRFLDVAGNGNLALSQAFDLTTLPLISFNLPAPVLVLGQGIALNGHYEGATAAEATQSKGAVTVLAAAGVSTFVYFRNGDKLVTKTVSGLGMGSDVAAAGNAATTDPLAALRVPVVLTQEELSYLGDGKVLVSAQSQQLLRNGSYDFSPVYEVPGGFTLDTVAPTNQVVSASFASGFAEVNQTLYKAVGDTGWHADDLITLHDEQGLYLIQGSLSAPLQRSKNADGTDKVTVNADGSTSPVYEETVKVLIPGQAEWFEGTPMSDTTFQVVIKNNPLRKIIDNSTWVPLTMKIRVEDSAGNASQEFSQQYQDENVKPLIEVFSNRTTFNKPTATQTDFTDTAELTIMLTEPDHDATSGPGLELSDLLVVRQSRNNRDYITNFHEVTEGGFTPHTVYKATYVFTSTSTEAPMIQIAAGAFTDRAGNVNVGGIFSVLDNVTPTINVRSDMPANLGLKAGQSAKIIFDISEVSFDFNAASVLVKGGVLSDIVREAADPAKGWVYGRIYTATFTPTADSVDTASVYVANGKFHDAAGNANEDGSNDNNTLAWAVDTQIPKLVSADITASTGSAINNQPNSPVVLSSGKRVTFSVSFDQDVVVQGVPQLAVAIGNIEDTPVLVLADYASGSGSRVLTFSYQLPAGVSWNDADGLSLPQNPLRLSTGASIQDATSGAPVNPSLAVQGPFARFMVDSLAPSLQSSLGAGVANGTTAAEATQAGGVLTLDDENGAAISVTFTQGNTTITRAFTGAGGTARPITLTASELAQFVDGVVTVTLRATDVAGNASTATQTFTLDRVAPGAATIAAVGGDDQLSASDVSAPISVGVSAAAGASLVRVLVDTTEVSASGGAYSFTASTLTQGSHTLSVVSTDAAGNQVTHTRNFVVDTVAPSISLASAEVVVLDGANPADVLFNVNASDAGALTYQINPQLGDHNSFEINAQGDVRLKATPVRSAKADYSLTLLVTDDAGNSTSQTYTVRVINPPGANEPVALLNDLGGLSYDGVTNDGTVRVNLPANTLYWQYSVNNGSSWTTGIGETFKLLEGTYPDQTIKVKITDLSNAVTSLTLNTRVVVDTSAPADPVAALVRDTGASATDGVTNDGTVSVTLADDVNRWQYSVDAGKTWMTGAPTKSFVLPDGTYAAGTVLVKAVDLGGNTSLSKLSTALSVDGNGPVLQSAYVSMDGTKLVLTYSEDLANAASTPTSAFAVTVGTSPSQTIAVSALVVTGNTVELTLASAVAYAQVVTLQYTDPTANDDAAAIQDAFGNDALTIGTALPVANFVSSPTSSTLTMAAMDNSRPLDPGTNLVLKPGMPVVGVAGKYITITDVGGTHYRGENAVHSFQIDASDTTKVTIVSDGADTRIIINPDLLFDLDLSSTYTVSVQPGAFMSTEANSTVESKGLAPVKFTTVAPGLTIANAIQAYRFDESTGQLVAANRWVDIEANGQGTNSSGVGNAVVLDATGGNYTFVMKDAWTAGANVAASESGIWAATDFSVLLSGVGQADRLYIDDATHNVAQRNDAGLSAFSFGPGSTAPGTLKWTIGTATGVAELYVQPVAPTSPNPALADSSLAALNATLGLSGGSWIIGDGAAGGSNSTLTAPTGQHAVQYFVKGSQGRTALDLNLFGGWTAMKTQQTVLQGSGGLDAIFVHAGMNVDATHTGAGQDKIYFDGMWSDYASSIQFDGAANAMTLSRLLNGRLESVQFKGGRDLLIFADGVISADAIYARVNTPRTDAVIKADVMALVPDASRETSLAPLSKLDATSSVRAVAGGASGASFVGLGGGAGELEVVGSDGVDSVYVRDGSHIDATQLLGGSDVIYFNGNWADYTKTLDAANGKIRFSRTVTLDGTPHTEVVWVSAGLAVSDQDRLSFADGSVLTSQARTALTSSLSVAFGAVTGMDASAKTTLPPAAPVVTLGTGVADGATAAEANPTSGGVFSVSTQASTQVQLVFTNGVKAFTKTVAGTGSVVDVKLSSAEQALLGDGAITVRAQAMGSDDKLSHVTTSRFTLDTHVPSVSISVDKPLGVVTGQTALVRFSLTEPSANFTLSDVAVTGGTLSSFSGSGSDYSAIFTATGGASAASISVSNDAFQDAAGNANTDGADGNNALNFSVNLTADTTSPTLLHAKASADGSRVVLTFSEALSPLGAGASSFSVNTGAVPVKSATVQGDMVVLELGARLLKDQAVVVTYTDPTGSNDVNAVQDAQGNDVATLTAQTVVTSGVLPVTDSGYYGHVVTPSFSSARVSADFFQGVAGISVAATTATQFNLATGAEGQVATALSTGSGALLAMTHYGQGRVAVIGQSDLIEKGLSADPTSGGLARGLFNLMNWLSGESRTIDQTDPLYILSSYGGISPNGKQSMFWESFNSTVGYMEDPSQISKPGNITFGPEKVTGQINSQDFAQYPEAAGFSEALTPSGAWSREYGVVVLPADASQAVVEMVRQWLHETGKGLLINGSGAMSEAVKDFLGEMGLTAQTVYHSALNITPPTITAIANQAPVVTDHDFTATEQNLYFPSQNMVITDAVAQKAKTVSIKLTGGGQDIVLLNQPIVFLTEAELTASTLTGESLNALKCMPGSIASGADLAAKLTARLNAVLSGDGTLTVSYDAATHSLNLNDPAGRRLEFFTLGQVDTSRTPNLVSTGSDADHPWVPTVMSVGVEATAAAAAVPSVERIKFTGSVKGTYSFNIHLKSSAGDDLILNDLAHGSVGLDENIATFARQLDAAVKARAPELSVAVVSVDDGVDPASTATPPAHKFHDELLFTDAKGRNFTRIEMMSTSTYEPLVSLAGDVTQGTLASGDDPAVATVATLGHYSGTVSASDVNGDTLTYTVLEGAKFGTVTINAQTGKWQYTPTAGQFQGMDNFTVQVSDGVSVSAPAQVTISSQTAPQVAMPSVKTFTIADPSYVQPAAKSTVVPGDFHWEDVFIAQTHVYRPTDPYLVLNANRYALIKVNATSPSGAAAPEFVATVTSKSGVVLGSLRLSGPELLPKTLDLPDDTNLGVQSDSNSYVAPLPAAWIQEGITVTITAGPAASPTTLSTFNPHVGADSQLVMHNVGVALWDANSYDYMPGLGTWGQEALAKLPAQSFKLYEYPSINIDAYALKFPDEWAVYTGNQGAQSLGSDPLLDGGGFNGDIKWAIGMAGAWLQAANAGNNYGIGYVGNNISGGGLGGGSVGGGLTAPGLLWHEVFGHGMGLPHVNANASYPLKGAFVEGFLRGPWIGPQWGYDQVTGTYLPNYYVDENGTPTGLKNDPMQGGNGMSDYLFSIFSDYYTYSNYGFISGKVQWISSPSFNAVDGGAGGDGYFKVWGSNSLKLALTGTSKVGQTLTLAITDANLSNATVKASVPITYRWYADGVQISGASSSTLVLTDAEAGKAISGEVLYTNSMGYAQRITSASTSSVALTANAGANHTGALTISSPAGGMVQAVLTDAEGFTPTGVTYTWYRGSSTTPITGAGVNGAALYLAGSDAGTALTVKATYTDKAGNVETVTSAATTVGTANVTTSVLPNGANTVGAVTLTIGAATPTSTTTSVGQTLTAAVSDADQVTASAVSYQWYSGGTPVSGATNATYKIRQEDLGKVLKVQANYTDLKGNLEVLTSSATPQVVMTGTWLLDVPSATNFEIPYKADQQVYWLMLNVATKDGDPISPGSTIYPGSSILPVQTIGDLKAPFHDILTDAGRSNNAGNYVLRVTYATPQGLLTEHLLMPWSSVAGGLNIANKGQLVRVDLVEAAGATVAGRLSAYANNTIVASYVNPDALANTVFQGDSGFAVGADNQLVLPRYWNGAQVLWSSSVSGLLDATTGAVDASKLTSSSSIKAQWWDGGVMHEQVYVLKASGNVNNVLTTLPTFTPLVTPADTSLSQAWTIQANTSDRTVVSGTEFDETVTIPAQLAGANVKHWVKLEVMNADGSLSWVDPMDSWTLTAVTGANGADSTLRVHGSVGRQPNVLVRSIKVYADDNVFDGTPASTITFPVNRGSVSTLIGVAVDTYQQVNGDVTADTLGSSSSSTAQAIRGDAGDDTLTGGTVADILDGGDGNDTLSGNGGNDRLVISAGTDVIHGNEGDANSLVVMVSNLNNLRTLSSDAGVRLISPDDDIDLNVSYTAANAYAVNGHFHAKASATTADGIQSVLVSDGATYAAVKIGSGSGDTLTAAGYEDASIERVVLFGAAGDDLGLLGVLKPTEFHGGSGQDIARLDWAGQMPVTISPTDTLVFRQDPITLDAHLSVKAANGTVTRLFDLQHTSGAGNDYQLTMHVSGGAVVQHRLKDVEQLRLNGVDGFGLVLDDTGVAGVTGATVNNDLSLSSLHSLQVQVGAATTNQVRIDWGPQVPVAMGIPDLLSDYAGTSTPSVFKTSLRVVDIDPAQLGFVMGGAYLGGAGASSSGQVVQVDRSLEGVVSFWVVTLNAGAYKAVKLKLTDQLDGIGIQAVQAKWVSASDASLSTFDFNTNGNAASVVTSDVGGGYGVKSIKGLAAHTLLEQDATGWAVSVEGQVVTHLRQLTAGQSDYELVLMNQSSAPVTDVLKQVSAVEIGGAPGYRFSVGTGGVTAIRGSSMADVMVMSSSDALGFDGYGGRDVLQLNWTGSSLPSLSAGVLTIVNGTNVGDWTLKAGDVNLLGVVGDGAGQFTLTLYQADGSTSVHAVLDVEYLALPQLQALKSSLSASALLGPESVLTLKLKPKIFTATFDQAQGLQTLTQTTPAGQTVMTHDTDFVLKGRADVGAVVQVYDGTRFLGTAVRDGANWSFNTDHLVERPYRFNIKVLDDAGNQATAAQTLTVSGNNPAHAPTHELVAHPAVANGSAYNAAGYNTVLGASSSLLLKSNQVLMGVLDASALGFTDGSASTADTVLLDLASNTVSLISRGSNATTTAGVNTAPAGVSGEASPRFVVFSTNDAASFKNNAGANFIDTRDDHGNFSDLMVLDTTTGEFGLVTHKLTSSSNATTIATAQISTQMHTANFVGITANSKYLIWSTPYAQDVGGLAGTTYHGGIFVYTLPSSSYATGRSAGESRLVNHAADITNYPGLVIGTGGYSNLVLGNDGNTLYFMTNDVSKLGNGATAFVDAAPTVSDLMAYSLETGVLTLVSRSAASSTTSAAAAVTWGGQNADGSVIYFSAADASAYGFVDNDLTKSDLIAYNATSNTYSLMLPGDSSTTLRNANESYVATIGNRLYFTADNAVAMGKTADGDVAGKDLYRLESDGSYTLLSHALSSTTTALKGHYVDNTLAVSADGRYVAFTYNVPGGENGGFQFPISGNVLMVADTLSNSISVVNHVGNNALATSWQVWGGEATQGFGDDGHSLVFTSSYLAWFNSGFTGSGQYDEAVLAYDIQTGQQRLLSHSADPSNMVQGSSAHFVGMSPDGKWALFSAPDASKFGNNGVAFIDKTPTENDLFAARVTTGELRLLTGIDGVSQGGGFTFNGFSEDSNSVYLGLGQLDGYKTAHGSLATPGALVDNTATGSDLASVRLTLLDLATSADATDAPGTTNATTDNLTTAAQLTAVANELSAFLTPGQVAQLWDGENLLSSATADASGKAVWNLTNVSRGDHRYWLYDPAEAQQILLNNSYAASELTVRVL